MSDRADYHKTVADIIAVLDAHGVSYKTFEHEEVRTSEEAASVRPEYSLEQGAKALIVRVKERGGGEKKFVQLVVPGNARFDTKKARTVLNAKDIRFATEDEVLDITDGIKPGGVPPFGNLFGLPVYADNGLFIHEEIIFNAGDRRFSIALKTKDYKTVVAPIVAELS